MTVSIFYDYKRLWGNKILNNIENNTKKKVGDDTLLEMCVVDAVLYEF